MAEAANARQSILKHSPYRAHRTLACLTPLIAHLLRRQWPLPPPTGPSVMLGLSSETYRCFSSLQRRYPPPSAGALLCPAPALSLPCRGDLPVLRLRSYLRIAGANPLPSPAIYLALGRRSVRDSTWVARRGAPAQRERYRALCSAPALSTALRGRSPHPALALFLRYACALPRAAPAPTPALYSRSPQHYTGALPHATPALGLVLRRRSLLRRASAIHWATRALSAGAGTIPFVSQLFPRSSLRYAGTLPRTTQASSPPYAGPGALLCAAPWLSPSLCCHSSLPCAVAVSSPPPTPPSPGN